jgi:two-component system cell cycle sensor histidine kinase/response regulator CckA
MNTPIGATVLIVEDDPGIAELETNRLMDAGYHILVAGTAEEAINHLHRNRIDLILLDYRLPGAENGLDFYARVKAAGFDVPVILVTGFGNEATVIHALRIGVRDFVTKSIEYLDYIPEAVGRVLRQVQTEHRLAESEARLAAVIQSAQDAVIVIEADRITSLFNPAAERMFGCTASEAVGRPIIEFIPDEPDISGDPKDLTLSYRLRAGTRGVRTNGESFPLEASVSRGQVNGQVFYTVVVRDMTERRRLEEQFRQSQKMEAIGQLAGGVAHDFNNLLTVINGYSELLLESLPLTDPGRSLIEEIRRAGERSAGLTRQLLAFSRKEVVAPRLVNMNAVVVDVERMLRRVVGEDVILVTKLSATGSVLADPGQLEQVLLNLAVNARDAMPTGGTLTISTENVVRNGPSDGSTGRSHIAVSVTDTGCGITDGIRNRIFEPFFTTKGIGKGTGLGLAVVHGVITQNGGTVEVESTPGSGTTFRFYLPRTASKSQIEGKNTGLQMAPKGTETILLVEDENSVRALSSYVLQANGYTVLEARDGGEAVRISNEHVGTIDLLVTDVVMPGIDGREVAEQLRKARPGLRVLYLSGYTDDAILRYGVATDQINFLLKPFTASTLAIKVREILDGSQDAKQGERRP